MTVVPDDPNALREIVVKLDEYFGKVLNAYMNADDEDKTRIARLVLEDMQGMPSPGSSLPPVARRQPCLNLICGPCELISNEALHDLLNRYGQPTVKSD